MGVPLSLAAVLCPTCRQVPAELDPLWDSSVSGNEVVNTFMPPRSDFLHRARSATISEQLFGSDTAMSAITVDGSPPQRADGLPDEISLDALFGDDEVIANPEPRESSVASPSRSRADRRAAAREAKAAERQAVMEARAAARAEKEEKRQAALARKAAAARAKELAAEEKKRAAAAKAKSQPKAKAKAKVSGAANLAARTAAERRRLKAQSASQVDNPDGSIARFLRRGSRGDESDASIEDTAMPASSSGVQNVEAAGSGVAPGSIVPPNGPATARGDCE